MNAILAANALSAMVSRMAFATDVLGDKWSLEQLVDDQLILLWTNALGISDWRTPSA